jgi:hypothetical protein
MPSQLEVLGFRFPALRPGTLACSAAHRFLFSCCAVSRPRIPSWSSDSPARSWVVCPINLDAAICRAPRTTVSLACSRSSSATFRCPGSHSSLKSSSLARSSGAGQCPVASRYSIIAFSSSLASVRISDGFPAPRTTRRILEASSRSLEPTIPLASWRAASALRRANTSSGVSLTMRTVMAPHRLKGRRLRRLGRTTQLAK